MKQRGTFKEQVDMIAGSQPRGSRSPTLQGPVCHRREVVAPGRASERTVYAGAMRSCSGNNVQGMLGGRAGCKAER